MERIKRFGEFINESNIGKLYENEISDLDDFLQGFGVETRVRGNNVLFKLQNKPHKLIVGDNGDVSIKGNYMVFNGTVLDFKDEFRANNEASKFDPEKWLADFAKKNKATIEKKPKNYQDQLDYKMTYGSIYGGAIFNVRLHKGDQWTFEASSSRNSTWCRYDNPKEAVEELNKKVSQIQKEITNKERAIEIAAAEFTKRGHKVSKLDANHTKLLSEYFSNSFAKPTPSNLGMMLTIGEMELVMTCDPWNLDNVSVGKVGKVGMEGNVRYSERVSDEKGAGSLVDKVEKALDRFMKGSMRIISSALGKMKYDIKIDEQSPKQLTDGEVTASLKYKNSEIKFKYSDDGINLYYTEKNSTFEPTIVNDKDSKGFARGGGTIAISGEATVVSYVEELIKLIDDLVKMDNVRDKLGIKADKYDAKIRFEATNMFGNTVQLLLNVTPDDSTEPSYMSTERVVATIGRDEFSVDRIEQYGKDYSFPTGDKFKDEKSWIKAIGDHIDDIKSGF